MQLPIKAIIEASKWLDSPAFAMSQRILQYMYALDYARLPGLYLQGLVYVIGLLSLFRAPDFFKYNKIGLITDHSSLYPSYDFIVVGGGIAGCLIAKRLSDGNFTVLLVHGPGKAPNVLLRVPYTNLGNFGDPRHDYSYEGAVIPELHWNTHQITYNSGKDLGGSQVLSGQVWSYGKPGDYLRWRTYNISTKFSYSNIRKFGALHEKADSSVEGVDFEYGRDGEIHLSHPDEGGSYSMLADMFEKAAAKISDTNIIQDHSGTQLGFGRITLAVEQETGYISTPTRAFFEKGYNKEKLHILAEHMVSRVLFDMTSDPPRAKGVQILRLSDGYSFNVTARMKVVLSGGAVKTPQLLILSGVGPAEVMFKFSVPPVAVREGVGRNLHDHNYIGSAAACFDRGHRGYSDLSLSEIMRFAFNGTGIMKLPYGLYSMGVFRSKSERTVCKDPMNKETCAPDFEIVFQQVGPNTQLGSKFYLSSGISERRMEEDFFMINRPEPAKDNSDKLYHQKDCVTIAPILSHPEARGTITLTSDDVMENPIINIDPTASKRDMLLMGELYQISKRIGNEAFSIKGGAFSNLEFPECRHIKDKESNEYGACQVKPYLRTLWHLGGTCRLGEPSDPLAVVDENFHVIGVRDLVVADASLNPRHTSGHMLATISALAEMAAQELLQLRSDN